jgi:sarcosine oxidase, subunit gamma
MASNSTSGSPPRSASALIHRTIVGTLTRTGPLHHRADDLGRLPEGVQIVPKPYTAMITLRLDPDGPAAADVAGHLGLELPTTASTWVETDGVRVIWLGPDEWLVTSPFRTPRELEAGLREVVAGRGAVVDVSGQRTTLWLTGEHVRDVLAGGCSVDLHPRVFRRGAAVQTLLGLASVVLLALDDTATSYHVLVRSSFAPYLVSWLLDAATEYSDAEDGAGPP